MRLACFAFAALLSTPAFAGIQSPEPISGPIRVIDGDTVELSSGERVRIYNIDAPETHEPRCDAERRIGEAATTLLRSWLLAPDVTISRCEPSTGRCLDKYGRTLATLATKYEGDLGEAMIAMGLALPWQPGRDAHDARARYWCGG